MFNFKKLKQIEEPTPLYTRLEKLYLACKEICKASYRNDAKANFKFSSVWGLSVTFQSEQGELLIVPDYYEPICNEEPVAYLSYYKVEEDNNPKSLFHITAEEHSTKIKPMLGEELSAKDIDLAIYEFEQYIYKTLEKVRAKKAKHTNEVKKLEQGEIE